MKGKGCAIPALAAAVLFGVCQTVYGASSVITAGQAEKTDGIRPVFQVSAGLSPGESGVLEPGAESDVDYDVRKFQLDDACAGGSAAVLVVVEGTGGSDCRVYAYEQEDGSWKRRLQTEGYLGENGMSNNRTEGDKTTPIGVFAMTTAFGQLPALEGFPEDYIQVKESHVWRTSTNQLVDDVSAYGDGEQVGTHWYREYYDYAINMGYNIHAIPQKGSALFLHCIGQGKTYTSGCVAIPKEDMVTVLRLCGSHPGEGAFIALAPKGTFGLIYDSYGVNNGLSPEGNF